MTDCYEKLRAQHDAMRKAQHDKEHARIIAQRDRLAELLRRYDYCIHFVELQMWDHERKVALAELDKEKQL